LGEVYAFAQRIGIEWPGYIVDCALQNRLYHPPRGWGFGKGNDRQPFATVNHVINQGRDIPLDIIDEQNPLAWRTGNKFCRGLKRLDMKRTSGQLVRAFMLAYPSFARMLSPNTGSENRPAGYA
jgi:hypothetical protein